MLQISWECGFIVVTNLSKYTMNGRQDKIGVMSIETSLTYLVSNCQDFEEEELLLQTMGWEIGIIVNHMLKCHCELAREGIGYTWGFAKNRNWTMRLMSENGKENFKEAVKKCISRDLLTTERIRKFSRNAHRYNCAYYKICNEQKNCKQQQQHQTYQVDENTTPVKWEKTCEGVQNPLLCNGL